MTPRLLILSPASQARGLVPPDDELVVKGKPETEHVRTFRMHESIVARLAWQYVEDRDGWECKLGSHDVVFTGFKSASRLVREWPWQMEAR